MKLLKGLLELSLGILLILLIILGLRYRQNIWDYTSDKLSNLFQKEEAVPTMAEQGTDQSSEEDSQSQEENLTPVQNSESDSTQEGSQTASVEGSSGEDSAAVEDKNVTLTFTGDILLTGYLLGQYDGKGIQSLVSDTLLEEMKNADLTMANEEFPFSSRGEPEKDKQFTFRIDPSRVNVLSELGINIVTLANNHTLDYGRDALADTVQALDQQGIRYVGAGENLDRAKQLQTFTIKDKTIGILGASRVLPDYNWNATKSKSGIFSTYDTKDLLNEIKVAKESCNFVIVYVHWGIEKKETPEDYQRDMAKQYIDAGADIVIGSHPHVLQGMEYYKGKPIVYSLGNFIFGNQITATGLLKVQIQEDDSVQLSLLPCKTDANYTLQVMQDGSELMKHLNSISYHAKVNTDGSIIEAE